MITYGVNLFLAFNLGKERLFLVGVSFVQISKWNISGFKHGIFKIQKDLYSEIKIGFSTGKAVVKVRDSYAGGFQFESQL